MTRALVFAEGYSRRIRQSLILVAWLGLLLSCHAAGAQQGEALNPPLRTWSSDLLHDPANWPHAEPNLRIAATPAGLRVEVAVERRFAIAAMSRLGLPSDWGRIRVRVTAMGGGATWFVRLYGELRRPGERRTVAIAEDEHAAGERVFPIDPRMRQLPDAPLQLQLGVEGPPGAFVVFADVAFLPPVSRPNRQARKFFQPGQKDIAAVQWMPNLPEPFELIDWREKARAYDRFVFDLRARGEFLPLVWLDESHVNNDRTTFDMLGGIVRTTNVPGILQLDCLATDFFRREAYPTFLCYNPYREERSFQFAAGPEGADLYDAVRHRMAMRNVRDQVDLTLPPDSAALIVVVPTGGKMTRQRKRTLVDGVVIDWRSGPD